MTDYTRPPSQWQDSPASASAMEAWSLAYDADTGVVSLVQGWPQARGGLIQTSEDPSVWVLVERVNGEVEADVVYLADRVQITAE